MTTLKRNTPATWIHGLTGQELEDVTLAAGTAYRLEGPSKTRPDGTATASILVPPDTDPTFRYRVDAQYL